MAATRKGIITTNYRRSAVSTDCPERSTTKCSKNRTTNVQFVKRK